MASTTFSGPITSTNGFVGDMVQTVETAEHAAGAIGTGATPKTYRWIENGVIITQIKLDLTGLTCGDAADDVIGVATDTPAAYIGRNVVATNGVIFKVEMACLEVPAGGDPDINFVVGSAATNVYSTPVTGAVIILDSGDLAAGVTIQKLTPSITANYYYYLTCGTATAAAYTTGQVVITTYGHAALA